jgi:catechol 2,3-dioxygenase-like lactoylglutathione lyase family enzyme
MLHSRRPLPTIPASDLARARAWYADKLGFIAGQDEAEAVLYRHGEESLFLLFSSPDAGTASHQLQPGMLRTWRRRSLSCGREELSLRITIFPACARRTASRSPR